MVLIKRGIKELKLYFIRLYLLLSIYRRNTREGAVCLFVKEPFCCKTRQDLSINRDAIKSLCLEIANEKSKT